MYSDNPEHLLQELHHAINSSSNTTQQQRFLSLLQTQLPQILQQNETLQSQLTQKNAQIKQTSRKLRKAHSKLAKKQEEVDELKSEVQRVNAICSQKIEKMSKWQGREGRQEVSLSTAPKKEKKKTLQNTDTQCQILNQSAFQESSRNNNILKDKLQQIQTSLLEERRKNRDLTLRLEVINVLQEPDELDHCEDNSTLDADSLRGDPFDEEEGLQFQSQRVDDEKEEEKGVSGWAINTWRSAVKVYQNWTCKH